ncbi:MAG: hypothetical protein OHK0022_20830 [Roseiflexaceae bacterium]
MEQPWSNIKEFIREADRRYAESYSSFVDYVNSYHYPLERSNADPFSPEYRAWVIREYLSVAELDHYDPEQNESARLDSVPLATSQQFPYSTKDPVVVGNYLAGIAMVMRALSLPAGSKLIEYGAGWGHLAMMLGESGFDVTCIDIEPVFVDLINARGKAAGVAVRAERGAFGTIPAGMTSADGVLFMEAFHHSLDHLAVVKQIYSLLRPGGEFILGAECIYPWFDCPWGIRPDGHAIWAVNKLKWMELGFSENYFVTMLMRNGFIVSKTLVEALGPMGLVYKGVKLTPSQTAQPGFLPPESRATWAPGAETDILFAGKGSHMPLADLAGCSEVTVSLTNYLPVTLRVEATVGGDRRSLSLKHNQQASLIFRLRAGSGPLSIRSDTACPQKLGLNDDTRELGAVLTGLVYR